MRGCSSFPILIPFPCALPSKGVCALIRKTNRNPFLKLFLLKNFQWRYELHFSISRNIVGKKRKSNETLKKAVQWLQEHHFHVFSSLLWESYTLNDALDVCCTGYSYHISPFACLWLLHIYILFVRKWLPE